MDNEEEKTRLCFGTTEFANICSICVTCAYFKECGAIPLNEKIKRNKRLLKFDKNWNGN
jgi:hypothetical protein